ncbi:MAG TPA: class I SAM-dependent methyltransferase [Chitinophagales bacterium]|nr:class I SAM-dependent methyltransferase [Chitinophagales bacterium]
MIKHLKYLYRNTYKTFFSKYDVILEKESKNYVSLLDVGCGSYSPISSFSKKLYCVGVDLFEKSIEESKSKGIHNDYVICNVLDIDKHFESNQFDIVVACDVIEHLEKVDGWRLMEKMESIAKHKVVFYTPNGFLDQGDRFNNPWQVHHSGWTADDFKNKGYKVIGINGVKSLRGEYAKVKYKPAFLWNFISDITELFVRNKPEKAFQLFAIKKIK